MLSTDHENTLMCLLLKKIKFSKFYHVSDQTRFLCVILSDFDQVLCDLKVSKSEIDLWGIPHWGIQCFRSLSLSLSLREHVRSVPLHEVSSICFRGRRCLLFDHYVSMRNIFGVSS